ncbi:MAG: rRNA maturation RNase YbeY [Nitrospiraceae bacterium]|nr:rRNA maturation RNase YbeY [Nitrospiraceae bacterium]
MKILITNQQEKIKINEPKIMSCSKKAMKLLGLDKSELSILLVDDRKMKKLNKKYRKINKTTDVLSFPLDDRIFLGDIVISPETAARQAEENDCSFWDEMKWLIVHGILHLTGYDHEKSLYAERKMRLKEKELLRKMRG